MSCCRTTRKRPSASTSRTPFSPSITVGSGALGGGFRGVVERIQEPHIHDAARRIVAVRTEAIGHAVLVAGPRHKIRKGEVFDGVDDLAVRDRREVDAKQRLLRRSNTLHS